MPWTKVYVDKNDVAKIPKKKGLRVTSYKDALREAQAEILREHNNAFILGEGVDDAGGVFGTTLGLVEEFGKDRIMDLPLAENGLTGVAIGAASAGMKPIFVHMRMDFLPMCMDQIINHAAKLHYMTGGQVKLNFVIRSIIGRGWGSSAQHSQGLHGLFTHIPGLKVVMPSTPYDAKGLLKAAIEDGSPIMFCEHRWIYDSTGYVPNDDYRVEIGKGIVRKRGKDVTIVAISQMVYEATKAAKVLDKEGIDVEIIDPRTLKPLDEELILESVKKTGRLVIADVACKTGGFGAEIACRVIESSHTHLRAPIKRVNFPDVPTPCSPVLEKAYYPDSNDIANAVRETMKDG